jgi:hypothetical protein
MREIKTNYLKILRIEIEDLKQDIEILIEGLKREHESELLTNYVFMENLIVFRNELLGVDDFYQVIDSTDPDKYATLDEMIAAILASFSDMVVQRRLPREIIQYVERKMAKVKQYVIIQL